jgi:hypothetical protein
VQPRFLLSHDGISIGRAEALRRAMLKLLADGTARETHPIYWPLSSSSMKAGVNVRSRSEAGLSPAHPHCQLVKDFAGNRGAYTQIQSLVVLLWITICERWRMRLRSSCVPARMTDAFYLKEIIHGSDTPQHR